MSDGPYKTLKMSRPWRTLAKLAENAAHSLSEVAESLPGALFDDWKSIRSAFASTIQAILSDGEKGSLFREVAVIEVQRIRAIASNPMEALLGDCALDSCRDCQPGPKVYEYAVVACLEERASRRALQIEEHYLRESLPDAGRLRARLYECVSGLDAGRMAASIATKASTRSFAPKVDRSGLDEGVVF